MSIRDRVKRLENARPQRTAQDREVIKRIEAIAAGGNEHKAKLAQLVLASIHRQRRFNNDFNT